MTGSEETASSGRSLLRGRKPEEILEAELSWIASLVLFFATVYVTVRFDVLWIVFGITAISLYVLPIVSLKDPFHALPWEMVLLLAAPLLLHISEGSKALTDSISWWSDFTSIAFAFSLATIGLLLTIELHMYTDLRMNRPFAVFFVIIFTMGATGLWFVGEYVGDVVNGTNHIGTNTDAMKSMTWSLIGGLVMGFVYDLYLRAMSESRQKTLGFIHIYEVTGWRKG